MDHRGASEGPGRRPSSPSSGTPMGAKGQAALSVQKPSVKVTPFHGSPIASSDGALRSTRPAASAHGSLFLDTFGRLTAPPVRGRAAAGSSEDPPPSSGSAPAPTGVKLQPAGRKALKSSTKLCPSLQGQERRAVSSKPPSAVKRRKRKMGMYNLVPKKKVKAIKQQEKKEEPGPGVQQNRAAAEEEPGPIVQQNRAAAEEEPGPSVQQNRAAAEEEPGPSVQQNRAAAEEEPGPSVQQNRAAAEEEPGPSVQQNRAAAEEEEPGPSVQQNRAAAEEEPGPSVQQNRAAAEEEKPVMLTETLQPLRSELLVEGDPGEGEYTELALECLDLKAQEELLSPPLSDAKVTESDLLEELPLCCCRMETPYSGDSLSTMEQTCMAMESMDGMLSRCQRRVMKQEMMRPSNTVHLLVLCEEHRAGMVKHHCCPGCGLFCRAGTFMECRPYGSISHRFHRNCASILKDLRFCPHCGEDASVAIENPNPGRHSQLFQIWPPCHQYQPRLAVLHAYSELRRAASHRGAETRARAAVLLAVSPGQRARPVCATDRIPKEPRESILTALDDDNLKPKKVKYPTRQLYISAKQGELQKVIQLLVDGKDPNFLMEGPNRVTPLHAAAAEGQQEICHMLVQAGANLDMCDEEQRTPLMAACENNHVDTVKYLLRAGAAVSHKDIMGFTCLHLAAKLGHHDIIHHLLSKASKYINCQDDGGWTPITWAIEHKHRELVHLLLARGADVNIRDKEENVCVHWAALSGCDDLAQALLEARCDLSAVNVHGDSALHVAARENHLECVMLFLSRGADITQRNREGGTALDCCMYGSKVWTALSTNKKLTDARRGRDCRGERVLS
ncbi:hypothetical protein KUCAC02_034924, partial [Chaenocephalus aceratus]